MPIGGAWRRRIDGAGGALAARGFAAASAGHAAKRGGAGQRLDAALSRSNGHITSIGKVGNARGLVLGRL